MIYYYGSHIIHYYHGLNNVCIFFQTGNNTIPLELWEEMYKSVLEIGLNKDKPLTINKPFLEDTDTGQCVTVLNSNPKTEHE